MSDDAYYATERAKNLTVKLYPSQLEAIKEKADRDDRSVGYIVRRAIDSHLDIPTEEDDDEI